MWTNMMGIWKYENKKVKRVYIWELHGWVQDTRNSDICVRHNHLELEQLAPQTKISLLLIEKS